MAYFDFLHELEDYSPDMVTRMNRRHARIVAPFKEDLIGAQVLDLAAHDGRWSYALAEHAERVVGVEARPDLIDRFAQYPAGPQHGRVKLVCDDIYRDLDKRLIRDETFDAVMLFGIYYHVMDHYGLLARVTQLEPELIVIDSEFMVDRNPIIQMVKERTDNPLNAIAQVPGQEVTMKGVPSTGAMERMADVLAPIGYAPVDAPDEADLVILNTCHIREKAAEKVYSELGRIRKIKDRNNPDMKVAVAGCVAQAEGAEIMRRAPIVDMVLGPQTYHKLPEMIAKVTRDAGEVLETDFETVNSLVY